MDKYTAEQLQSQSLWGKLKGNKKYLLFLFAGALLIFFALTILMYKAGQKQEVNKPKPEPKPSITPTPMAPHVKDQIILKYKTGVSEQTINEHLLRYNATIIKRIDAIHRIVVHVPQGQGDALLKEFQKDNLIEEAKPDYIYKVNFVPNDPYLNQQWGLANTGQTINGQAGTPRADVNAEQAWEVTKGDDSIKIAILDTGTDSKHPDLQSKITAWKVFTGTGTEDNFGHGTHAAGIAAAVTDNATGITGTCPKCNLMNVKVLDDNGSGQDSDIVDGIIWAADNGAKVISMSLGGTSAGIGQDAIDYAWDKGAVLVASAGNDGNTQRQYPAAYKHVVSVAATTNTDSKASFSTYGTWVSVAAPGSRIYSTLPTYSNGLGAGTNYGFLSGTSMAAPMVAGVAGLIWSSSYGTSNHAVVERLYKTADKISGTGTYWIYGRVNAGKAVGVESTNPTPTQPQPSPTPTDVIPTIYCIGSCPTLPPPTPTAIGQPTSTPTPRPQCSDGIDNDGDGLVDLMDPGCEGRYDNNETNPPLACPLQTIWQLGSFDATLSDIDKDEYPANDKFTPEFTYNIVNEKRSSHPYMPGYLSDRRISETFPNLPSLRLIDATKRLVINFTLAHSLTNSRIIWSRYGSETNALVLDGQTIRTASGGAEGKSVFFRDPVTLDATSQAGQHTVRIEYLGGGANNGNYLDAIGIVGCDPTLTPTLTPVPTSTPTPTPLPDDIKKLIEWLLELIRKLLCLLFGNCPTPTPTPTPSITQFPTNSPTLPVPTSTPAPTMTPTPTLTPTSTPLAASLQIRKLDADLAWGENVSVGVGEDVELQWTSSNAQSCKGDSYFNTNTGGPTTAGVQKSVEEPGSGNSRTYAVTCKDASGAEKSDTATVSVTGMAVKLEIRKLNADPEDTWSSNIKIDSGEDVELRWTSAGATRCVANSDNFSTVTGGSTTAGVQQTVEEPVGGKRSYTITCYDGPSNTDPHNSDTVEVIVYGGPPPSCTLTASPSTIASGEITTLSWTTTSVVSGNIDYNVGNMSPVEKGQKSVSPTTDTTYTAKVSGTGLDATATCSTLVKMTMDSATINQGAGNIIEQFIERIRQLICNLFGNCLSSTASQAP